MSSSFTIVWDWPALATFHKLPLHTATMIDHAIIRLVESGEGQIEWVAPHHRLRVGFYEVALAIDSEQGVVTVLRIYRAR